MESMILMLRVLVAVVDFGGPYGHPFSTILVASQRFSTKSRYKSHCAPRQELFFQKALELDMPI